MPPPKRTSVLSRLSSITLAPLLFLAALGFGAAGCTDEPTLTGDHASALTGAACTPDEDSYMDRAGFQRSAPIDCTGDTTDIDHPGYCCHFPQPGCDKDGCCDADIVQPPDID